MMRLMINSVHDRVSHALIVCGHTNFSARFCSTVLFLHFDSIPFCLSSLIYSTGVLSLEFALFDHIVFKHIKIIRGSVCLRDQSKPT